MRESSQEKSGEKSIVWCIARSFFKLRKLLEKAECNSRKRTRGWVYRPGPMLKNKNKIETELRLESNVQMSQTSDVFHYWY